MAEVLWIPSDEAQAHSDPDCPVFEAIEGEVYVEEVDALTARSIVTEALGVVELCDRCLKQLSPRPRADAPPVRARPVQTFTRKKRAPPPRGRRADPSERWNGKTVPQTVALLRAGRDGDGGHIGVAVMEADGRTWTCVVPGVGVRGGPAKGYVFNPTPNPPLLFHGRGSRRWRDLGPKATLSAQGHDQVVAGLRRELFDGLAEEAPPVVAHRVLSRFGIMVPEPKAGQTAEAWFASLGDNEELGTGTVIIEEPKPGEPGQPTPPTPAVPGGGDVPVPVGRARSRPLAVTRTFALATEGGRTVHLMASCPALNISPDAIVSEDHKGWTTAKEAAEHWDLPVCGQCERMRRAAGDGRVLGEYTLDRRVLTVRDDGAALTTNGLFGGREVRFIPRQDVLEATPEGPGFFSSASRMVVGSSHEEIVMDFVDRAERDSAIGLLIDVLRSGERG